MSVGRVGLRSMKKLSEYAFPAMREASPDEQCQASCSAIFRVGESPGEGTNRLLVLAGRNADEIARKFEQHALLRRCLERIIAVQTIEKVTDIDAEGLRNMIEPAGGYPVDAFFVLVSLLVGDADQLSHLLLRQTKHDPTLAHSGSDVTINILSA